MLSGGGWGGGFGPPTILLESGKNSNNLEHVGANFGIFDDDLAQIVTAWLSLRATLKAAVLAIVQLNRLRGWSIVKTNERFVLHPNTLRSWVKTMEEGGNSLLFAGAVVWNRSDDAVRWAAKELRRLCPEPECGTRTIARHLARPDIAMSRSTVQRVMREMA